MEGIKIKDIRPIEGLIYKKKSLYYLRFYQYLDQIKFFFV